MFQNIGPIMAKSFCGSYNFDLITFAESLPFFKNVSNYIITKKKVNDPHPSLLANTQLNNSLKHSYESVTMPSTSSQSRQKSTFNDKEVSQTRPVGNVNAASASAFYENSNEQDFEDEYIDDKELSKSSESECVVCERYKAGPLRYGVKS